MKPIESPSVPAVPTLPVELDCGIGSSTSKARQALLSPQGALAGLGPRRAGGLIASGAIEHAATARATNALPRPSPRSSRDPNIATGSAPAGIHRVADERPGPGTTPEARLPERPVEGCPPPIYPKWKSTDRMIVSSESDSTARRSAAAQQGYRNVRSQNFVTLASLAASAPEAPESAITGPLSGLGLHSRLDLHGHGSVGRFEHMSPEMLAKKLYDSGLHKVGVLKVQACHVGTKDYLPRLKDAMAARGMEVGYLSGFKGAVIPHTHVLNLFGKKINLRHTLTRKTVYDPREESYFGESEGLRVIKGNVDVGFKGTRYNLDESGRRRR